MKMEYLIERDERDKGGELTVIGEYPNLQTALAAWGEIAIPEDDEVQLWLLRRTGGPATSNVLDVKCK
jgi:hypothetical protein